MNTELLSAKASIKVMAASSSSDSMISSGSMISRRMHISWNLNIVIQSADDRRTSLLDMAREWLEDVVCQRVVMGNHLLMIEEGVEVPVNIGLSKGNHLLMIDEGVEVPMDIGLSKDWNELEIMGNHLLVTEGVEVPKDWNGMEIMGNHLLMTEGVEVPKDWNEMEIMGNHLLMTEGVEVPVDIGLSKDWLEMENLEHEAMEQLMINLGISDDQELGGVHDDEMLIDMDFDEEMEHSYLDRFLGILPSVEWREPVEEGEVLMMMMMMMTVTNRFLEILPSVEWREQVEEWVVLMMMMMMMTVTNRNPNRIVCRIAGRMADQMY